MAKVNKYFNLWAEINGVNSAECKELNALFARAIDAAKTGKFKAIFFQLKLNSNRRPSQNS